MATATTEKPAGPQHRKQVAKAMGPALESYVSSAVVMDTLVTIEVVNPASAAASVEAVKSAFGWFDEVEGRCSRFDAGSELSKLSATTGTAVTVSPLLFRAIEFAVSVAAESDGAFDPTVGRVMAHNGFDRNYRTGERMEAGPLSEGVSYQDVILDSERLTVTLRRPLTLDLGAVAKGLAVDLAAQALRGFESFAINAGGDLYLAGMNARREPWEVGIRHPRQPEGIADTVRVTDMAVCTSGDYERTGGGAGRSHHILNAASGRSAETAISATVVAPSAMLADALATASFVLGPKRGIALLERQGVEGMVMSPTLRRVETKKFERYRG